MSNNHSNNKGGLVYSTNPDFLNQNKPPEHKAQTLKPAEQKLNIKLDTKQRRGKVVTLIEGFIGTEEALETLAKQLKTKCGTGGTAKDGVIIIQGDYKVKITTILKDLQYNIKEK